MRNVFIILILLMFCCFMGAELNKKGITPEQLENATEKVRYDNLNLDFAEQGQDNNNTFFVRTVSKAADLYSFVLIDGSMAAINYGYENPQYNYDLAWKILFLTAFASLIIPLIYLVLFIGYFVKVIIDWIKKKNGRNAV